MGRAQSGFTIVELMITVAILAVLMALAVPSFQRLISSQKVATGASDLFLALMKTRGEAIKRNANVVLAPATANTWNGDFTITDQGSGTVIDRGSLSGAITVSGPANVVYQGSGRVQGSTVTPFSLTSSISGVTPRCISIDLSGRPNVKQEAC